MLHPGIDLTPEIDDEIMAELNVKSLERLDTLSGLLRWNVIPNFRALGPRLGQKVNAVKAALADADGSALQAQLESQGYIEIAGERLEASEVEVRAERHESLALVEDAGWAVALDLELTDTLRAEGTSRERVRALNDARKSAGFAIADRITVVIDADANLQSIIEQHRTTITTEVLATDLRFGPGDREIELDGATVSVGLRLG